MRSVESIRVRDEQRIAVRVVNAELASRHVERIIQLPNLYAPALKLVAEVSDYVRRVKIQT